jgi:hypothetical protein
MNSEYESLINNHMWTLRDLPFGRKPIRCKWISAIKMKPDGSLDRFKARLVAKGCSQKYGVDFHEMYSPTVKYDSIRIVLAIAMQENMDISSLCRSIQIDWVVFLIF